MEERHVALARGCCEVAADYRGLIAGKPAKHDVDVLCCGSEWLPNNAELAIIYRCLFRLLLGCLFQKYLRSLPVPPLDPASLSFRAFVSLTTASRSFAPS